MEIEKKYLIKQLPSDLSSYPHEEIEQAYLCVNPTLRIRRKGDKTIFTYKNRPEEMDSDSLCIADEVERPLTKEAFLHLAEKCDGRMIIKTRYLIPYHKYTIELDVFHGDYEGMVLAEVEFPTIEEGERFIPPEWFDRDVSGDIRYTNSYMAYHEE